MRFLANVCGLLGFIIVGACSQQAPSGESSTVVIQMPKSLGNGVFSSSACFAVSITGENIPATGGGSCDPSFGTFGGLVSPGGTIELETTFGDNRTIDIFYVISDQGCDPAFQPTQGLGQTFGSNNVYRVSHTPGLKFDQAEMTVAVQIEYPSNQNKLQTIMEASGTTLPASCIQNSTLVPLANVAPVRQVIGSFRGVTSAGNKVHLRVLDKKLDLKKPSDWSGQLKPIQLGVSQ